jgi:hypothetical protein
VWKARTRNKLVVEARLKGTGMHWARPHVDPLVALRNIACSDRWEEAWPQISCELRRQAAQRRVQQRQKRKTRCDALSARADATTVTEKTDNAPTPTEIPHHVNALADTEHCLALSAQDPVASSR